MAPVASVVSLLVVFVITFPSSFFYNLDPNAKFFSLRAMRMVAFPVATDFVQLTSAGRVFDYRLLY